MRDAHVFWPPHTDDESIAMGGAIARAVALGHHVTVALVTDNRPSERQQAMFPDAGRALTHIRFDEWLNALAALRVDHFVACGIPEMLMCADRERATALVVEQMEHLHRRHNCATVTHHAVVGASDTHADAGQTSLAHRLSEEAARVFARLRPDASVVLHKVYVYSHAVESRTAAMIDTLSEYEMAAKRRAINAYKPSATSIGYGYRSVRELFDAAETDPREFVQVVQ